MKNFYLYYQKIGFEYLETMDFEKAFDAFRRSLEINPYNLFLISRIADFFNKNSHAFSYLPILTEFLNNALRFKGEHSPVYEIASSASYINKKIMQNGLSVHSLNNFDFSEKLSECKRPKIVLLTCVWRRHELTKIVLSYYEKVREYLAEHVDITLLAIGSEGQASRRICEQHGFNYLEYKNIPLSDKWEFGVKSSQAFDPDGVVIVGSDDLISHSLFKSYAELLHEGYLFCGLSDGYFMDLKNPESILYWKGYGGLKSQQGMPWRLNETIGMGRFYSRTLLELIDYSLWGGVKINKGLDSIAKERLFSLGILPVLKQHAVPLFIENNRFLFGQVAMRMEDLGGIALDVKTFGENITSIDSYYKSKESCEFIPSAKIDFEKYFFPDTMDSLFKLAVDT